MKVQGGRFIGPLNELKAVDGPLWDKVHADAFRVNDGIRKLIVTLEQADPKHPALAQLYRLRDQFRPIEASLAHK